MTIIIPAFDTVHPLNWHSVTLEDTFLTAELRRVIRGERREKLCDLCETFEPWW